jgi:hypothetical protein
VLAVLSDQPTFLAETWEEPHAAPARRIKARWEENPWHGSDRETRDRAVRELFDELGERVGIGEPPSSFFERP